jgi:hypothetical protein
MSERLNFLAKISVKLIHSTVEPNTKHVDTHKMLHKSKSYSIRIMPGAAATALDHNTWRPEEPRSSQPAQRSAAPALPAVPGPNLVQDTNPTSSQGEEQPIARKLMERFKGLNACLRKPCPWLDTCRNLHLPFGKLELNEGLKKKCKFTPFSRVCKVLNGANKQPGPWAKTVKDISSLTVMMKKSRRQ